MTKEEITAEKRRFCLELLDTMAWYCKEMNPGAIATGCVDKGVYG